MIPEIYQDLYSCDFNVRSAEASSRLYTAIVKTSNTIILIAFFKVFVASTVLQSDLYDRRRRPFRVQIHRPDRGSSCVSRVTIIPVVALWPVRIASQRDGVFSRSFSP